MPSFAKFAALSGYTSRELEDFRLLHEDFALAYDECKTRLTDMISEGALTKRLDGSFAKFLLSGGITAGNCQDNEESDEFKVNITVVEQFRGD